MRDRPFPWMLMLPLIALSGPAMAIERHESIVIADTPKLTRWAAVHRIPDEGADTGTDDPYFHVEVFEHRKGAKPWAFKRLAQHMVITGAALEKSRIRSKARTYSYKDVEFQIVYKAWRDDPASRARTPVCTTSVTDCLARTTSDE